MLTSEHKETMAALATKLLPTLPSPLMPKTLANLGNKVTTNTTITTHVPKTLKVTNLGSKIP